MQAKNRYSCPVYNSLLQKHLAKNMPERAYMHDNEKLGNPGQVRKNRVKPLASEKYRIFRSKESATEHCYSGVIGCMRLTKILVSRG